MDEIGELGAHCLMVPHPNQGHINPALQFAKRLAHKRIRVTIALTKFILKSSTAAFSGGSISVRSISDGFDDGGRAHAGSSAEYRARFEQIGQQTLSELLHDLAVSGRPVDCVIYDPFEPWVLDVAKGLGLAAAAFFTQSCAVDSIYYRTYLGELKLPLAGGEVVVPGLPAMKPGDMPSFIYNYGSHPGTFEMILEQFRNVETADWIFINTFDELESQIIKRMSRFWRVKAIGPTIPSFYLDKRLHDDKEYGLTILKPTTIDCTNWLNQRPARSVIYVSFGSLSEPTVEQIQEVAWALTTSNKHFLWVVRSSEEAKLPPKFVEETPAKGLLVPWCHQLEVLAHEAVGCFVTHCGWNSTLEALSLGVPIVAVPQWTDQSTNAKFVADVWGTGVRARGDENGLVKRDEIVGCVENVMEGNDGNGISLNSIRWRKLAREAVDEGGSSDKNIEGFVDVLSRTLKRIIYNILCCICCCIPLYMKIMV